MQKDAGSNPSKGSKLSQTSAIVWLNQANLFDESIEADLRLWVECTCSSVLTTQLLLLFLMIQRQLPHHIYFVYFSIHQRLVQSDRLTTSKDPCIRIKYMYACRPIFFFLTL